MTMTLAPRSGSDQQAAAATAQELVPRLLSIAKTIRQLVGIKLAAIDVVAGQDQFLLSFEKDDAAPVADIAFRLSVRASTVSKMTDILERKGWVARSGDAGDGRRVLVRLTREGRAVADAVRDLHAGIEGELMHALSEEQDVLPVLARVDAVLARRLNRLR